MKAFKMKFRFIVLAAVSLCCLSCISKNNQLGGSLIPISQSYDIFQNDNLELEDISYKMVDGLSGISQTRITIGAIRDSEYGVTTRGCAVCLVPMFPDTLIIGDNPVFQHFHLAAAMDTLSCPDQSQKYILQNVRVYEMNKRLDLTEHYECNSEIPEHSANTITIGTPVYGGQDSLSFNFKQSFGEKYLGITAEDLKTYKGFLDKYPGIYIEMDKPHGNGGRINMFNLQVDYDSDDYYIAGTYAYLNYSAEFDGERKDTTLMFMLGLDKFYDTDSLITDGSTGSYPQYCLNLTGHETRSMQSKADKHILIEGGGGLKPVISAKEIKHLVEAEISAHGGNPKEAVINKASLVFPFEFPEDYQEMTIWPQILTPSCKIISDDGKPYFMSLTDSSSESENQGDVNRSLDLYAPDITYHVQEILKVNEEDTESKATKRFNDGQFDLWLMIMANEVTVTSTESNDELSEYYNYLAYQSYYSNMYGGGSSYSGNSYNNYYTYMMLAQYASSSQSSTSYKVQLDKDRYYKAMLNGPAFDGRRPRLEIVYSIPRQEEQ